MQIVNIFLHPFNKFCDSSLSNKITIVGGGSLLVALLTIGAAASWFAGGGGVMPFAMPGLIGTIGFSSLSALSVIGGAVIATLVICCLASLCSKKRPVEVPSEEVPTKPVSDDESNNADPIPGTDPLSIFPDGYSGDSVVLLQEPFVPEENNVTVSQKENAAIDLEDLKVFLQDIRNNKAQIKAALEDAETTYSPNVRPKQAAVEYLNKDIKAPFEACRAYWEPIFQNNLSKEQYIPFKKASEVNDALEVIKFLVYLNEMMEIFEKNLLAYMELFQNNDQGYHRDV